MRNSNPVAHISSCNSYKFNLFFLYTSIVTILLSEGRAGEVWERSNYLMLVPPFLRWGLCLSLSTSLLSVGWLSQQPHTQRTMRSALFKAASNIRGLKRPCNWLRRRSPPLTATTLSFRTYKCGRYHSSLTNSKFRPLTSYGYTVE